MPASQEELWRAAVDVLVKLRTVPAPRQLPLLDGSDYPIPSYDRGAMRDRGRAAARLVLAGAARRAGAAPRCAPSSWRCGRRCSTACSRSRRPAFCAISIRRTCCGCRSAHGLARVGIIDFQDAQRELDRLRPGVAAAGCARRRAGGPGGAAVRALPARGGQARAGVRRRCVPVRLCRASVHSEIPRSSAFSCGCHVATARPSIWRICRASGGYLERNLRNPRLAGLAAWYDRHFPADTRTGALPA